jgi:hypothetical protein
MTKVKKSPTGQPHREPVEKKTLQGQGRRSKASHGRKKMRGQGR